MRMNIAVARCVFGSPDSPPTLLADSCQKEVASGCMMSSSLRSWRSVAKSSAGEGKSAAILPCTVGRSNRGCKPSDSDGKQCTYVQHFPRPSCCAGPFFNTGPRKTAPLAPRSVPEVCRHLAAIGCELVHDLLMQPYIHGRRIACVTGVVEFGSKLLSSADGAVKVEELQQVDDGGFPVELLGRFGGEPVQDLLDVDFRYCLRSGRCGRCGRCRDASCGARGRSWGPGRSRVARGRSRIGCVRRREDLAENVSENAHD